MHYMLLCQCNYQTILTNIKHKIIHRNQMMLTASVTEEYRCLVDILTCLVCKDMVSQAHICPNCSKFYCLNCIIRQLTHEEKCINCNRFLEVSMLINCQKLCSQLRETLEKVSIKPGKNSQSPHQKSSLYCARHCLDKTYYCKTCDRPLCSDCSVLTQNHRGHEFIKLSLMKDSYEEKVNQMLNQIKMAHRKIVIRKQMMEGLHSKKEKVSKQSITEFQNSMKLLKDEIRKGLKKTMAEGEKYLDKITQNLQAWNEKYQLWLSTLKNCSKGKFVQHQYRSIQKELIDLLQNINVQSSSIKNINKDIQSTLIKHSYVHPDFEQYTFFIQKYSQKCEESDFFYTDKIKSKMGLEWRLKIYPKGIAKEGEEHKIEERKLSKKKSRNEDYFSVFIEYIDGPVSQTKQKHLITLISQTDENKDFTRQFQSQFTIGQCWGYQHFMKLSQFYQQRYYNKDMDFIEIVLRISPINYYQACQDQLAFLNQKKRIFEEREGQKGKLYIWSMEQLSSLIQ